MQLKSVCCPRASVEYFRVGKRKNLGKVLIRKYVRYFCDSKKSGKYDFSDARIQRSFEELNVRGP